MRGRKGKWSQLGSTGCSAGMCWDAVSLLAHGLPPAAAFACSATHAFASATPWPKMACKVGRKQGSGWGAWAAGISCKGWATSVPQPPTQPGRRASPCRAQLPCWMPSCSGAHFHRTTRPAGFCPHLCSLHLQPLWQGARPAGPVASLDLCAVELWQGAVLACGGRRGGRGSKEGSAFVSAG